MERLLNDSERRDSGDQTPSPRSSPAARAPSPPESARAAAYAPPQPLHEPPLRQGYYSLTLPPVRLLSHHSAVGGSPTLAASGLSTPRLPPISMLTAAASLQPRMRITRAHGDSFAVAVAAPQMHADDQDNLCRYRNKRCGNARAIKRNGDRHNLCEKHRAKANQNQRKLESKRRTQKKVTTMAAATIVRTQHAVFQPQQTPHHVAPHASSYTAVYRDYPSYR